VEFFMSKLAVLPLRWFVGLLALLVALALACNAPLEPEPTLPPPAPQLVTQTPGGAVPPSADDGAAESTIAATVEATLPGEEEIATIEVTEPLPTFTPIQATAAATAPGNPTLAATVTLPSAEATATRPPTATATGASSGPLNFTFTIDWRLSPANPYQAIAHVIIYATGGDGNYSYYRDDLPVDGPEFEYVWAACRGNPGSLRVDSAGQSVRQNYFEDPPCPTPTPLP
jgi:hypothetical protein